MANPNSLMKKTLVPLIVGILYLYECMLATIYGQDWSKTKTYQYNRFQNRFDGVKTALCMLFV